ncbi:MAG TPA: cytochrome c [Chloroflexia bacterium]|nr:cytochrome c [Chloroflexia bacterium]
MLGNNSSPHGPARWMLMVFLCLLALFVPVVLSACDSSGDSGTLVRSGEVIFGRYCNTCHPGGGLGAGPSLIRAVPGLTDDQVRDIVRHGKTRMPGFTEQEISDAELDDLIGFVRGLK